MLMVFSTDGLPWLESFVNAVSDQMNRFLIRNSPTFSSLQILIGSLQEGVGALICQQKLLFNVKLGTIRD